MEEPWFGVGILKRKTIATICSIDCNIGYITSKLTTYNKLNETKTSPLIIEKIIKKVFVCAFLTAKKEPFLVILQQNIKFLRNSLTKFPKPPVLLRMLDADFRYKKGTDRPKLLVNRIELALTGVQPIKITSNLFSTSSPSSRFTYNIDLKISANIQTYQSSYCMQIYLAYETGE
jgi:hypothetical protein